MMASVEYTQGNPGYLGNYIKPPKFQTHHLCGFDTAKNISLSFIDIDSACNLLIPVTLPPSFLSISGFSLHLLCDPDIAVCQGRSKALCFRLKGKGMWILLGQLIASIEGGSLLMIELGEDRPAKLKIQFSLSSGLIFVNMSHCWFWCQ